MPPSYTFIIRKWKQRDTPSPANGFRPAPLSCSPAISTNFCFLPLGCVHLGSSRCCAYANRTPRPKLTILDANSPSRQRGLSTAIREAPLVCSPAFCWLILLLSRSIQNSQANLSRWWSLQSAFVSLLILTWPFPIWKPKASSSPTIIVLHLVLASIALQQNFISMHF